MLSCATTLLAQMVSSSSYDSLSNFRYTCNGGATFSDGTTEKQSTCENNNGTMEWSVIGDECRIGKEIRRHYRPG